LIPNTIFGTNYLTFLPLSISGRSGRGIRKDISFLKKEKEINFLEKAQKEGEKGI